jgi:hypothetical protein
MSTPIAMMASKGAVEVAGLEEEEERFRFVRSDVEPKRSAAAPEMPVVVDWTWDAE